MCKDDQRKLWNAELEKALREQKGPTRGELYGMDTTQPWPVPAKAPEQPQPKK